MADRDVDRVLVLAWRAGNRVAGNTLIRRYYHRIFKFMVRLSSRVDPSCELALDLTQQAFLECAKSTGGEQNFCSYIFSVARHVWFRRCRWWGYQRQCAEALCAIEASALPSVTVEPFLAYEGDEAVVRYHVKRLPPRQQDVVKLTYWDGMTNHEVKEVLSLESLGAVVGRLRKAWGLLERPLKRELGYRKREEVVRAA